MAENFDLIFGQSAGSQYAWSDSDYQNGWSTVGSTPPTAEQFDALQRRSDTKAQELNNALTPLVAQNTANNRQPLTAYALKDIRYSPLLPTGWFLECTTAGTTDSAEITLPSPLVENATITDGAVVWKVRKIGSGGGEAVGVIKAFAGNGAIPSGYLLCDGAAYSRTALPDLFAAIGTDYGSGDGSTTFNVPDSNQAKRFLQGDTVAGTVKQAGLPNITGRSVMSLQIAANKVASVVRSGLGAFYTTGESTRYPSTTSTETTVNSQGSLAMDASRSSSIYGNSTTVQPPALTTRYIIKAFDGQTADSALIDITQYAQELAHKAEINQSNMVHHRDVITTSGTYTAPATGLYKITIKGGGGGGTSGGYNNTYGYAGGGGGEGGTTIAYEKLIAGDTVAVVIGAGGAGGVASGSATQNFGADGGNSTVTVGANTYTAAGGHSTNNARAGGAGGEGTIHGAPGDCPGIAEVNISVGASGGGAGGAVGRAGNNTPLTAIDGGGGAGGAGQYNSFGAPGGAGGNGFVSFEYYTTGA